MYITYYNISGSPYFKWVTLPAMYTSYCLFLTMTDPSKNETVYRVGFSPVF